MTATASNHRRYCLLKWRSYAVLGDEYDGMRRVWLAKQEAISSTALPDAFPSLSTLQAAGYSTEADLEGADEAELVALGLTSDEAAAVVTAYAAL